jgi:AcrR family transcriptional regulator
MIVKVRATREEDKLERRNAILDAAAGLLISRPDSLASMDDLAAEAGVAKGTLYLYFPSKEEVLLALHERNMSGFFAVLGERLQQGGITRDELFDLTRVHLLEQPAYLSLASLVIGLLERAIPEEAALRFRTALGERLLAAGAGLERALGLPAGEGTRLLNYSYALIIGLWQLKGCAALAQCGAQLDARIQSAFVSDFPSEALHALNDLWAGALAQHTYPEKQP